ncbi:hypothetical protein F4823DRAFT_583482 [Ustulina deusta]|nr:hypothetical protein F4823DRAFT_583482 [Ustulina deusta]
MSITSPPSFHSPTLEGQRPETTLGRLVEDIYETPDPQSSNTLVATDRIIRALTNWYGLQYLFCTGFGDKFLAWDQRCS